MAKILHFGYMCRLIKYFGINNLLAETVFGPEISKESLIGKCDYLIAMYHNLDNGQNWHYSFEFMDRQLKGVKITENLWTVDEIISPSQWRYKGLDFNFCDPRGMNNKESRIVHKIGNTQSSIYYKENTFIETLNAGFTFFRALSKYADWKEFLESEEGKDYTIGFL